MRGKGSKCISMVNPIRITPAYAGKSDECMDLKSTYKDHPRLCGEKKNIKFYPPTGVGSPPPMRGKGEMDKIATEPFRITPAYAGKRFVATAKLLFY